MRNKAARVSVPDEFVTCSGSRDRVLYSSKVLPTGEISLRESGKEDIQEYINSFRESTDMNFILHQLSLGNTAVLNSQQMLFGDFTETPSSLADAQQMLIDGENAFYKLPLDVRQQFNNDFRNWLFTSGSSEWVQKMSSIVSASTSVVDTLKPEPDASITPVPTTPVVNEVS